MVKTASPAANSRRQVLVDPGQDLSAGDRALAGRRGIGPTELRRTKGDPPMRPVGVVVAGVSRQETVQMSATKDQRPVKVLISNGPYPALRERVGLGRA